MLNSKKTLKILGSYFGYLLATDYVSIVFQMSGMMLNFVRYNVFILSWNLLIKPETEIREIV